MSYPDTPDATDTSLHQTTDPAKPNWTRPEVIAAADDLQLIARLVAGTRTMWAHAREYIRKWKDESAELWEVRARIETVYAALERVLSAAIGMLFAKPPTVTWNQAETAFADPWANIDSRGTAAPVFIKRFADRALADGYAILLVDHPPPVAGATGLDQQTMSLRPTWAIYPRCMLYSWREDTIGNRNVPSQIVLYECAEVDDQVFGTATRHRFRVLRLVPSGGTYVATWTLYERQARGLGEVYVVIGSGIYTNKQGQTRDTLPFAVAYTGRTDAAFTARPPLLGVAYASLAYWQKATNLSFYEDWICFPQPVVKGELAIDPATGKPAALKIGPGTGVQVSADGDYEIVELSGTALEQLRKGLDEKLFRIASTALSFLLPQTRAAETAEAKRLDATAENSTLATAAQGIEDAVNEAVIITGWYLGIEPAACPVVQINRDFDSTALDSNVMNAYAKLVEAGFPKSVVLKALQTGGRIPDDADLEELELEWMADEAAKRQEAADRAAALGAGTGGPRMEAA